MSSLIGRLFKKDLVGITWYEDTIVYQGRKVRWGHFTKALSPVIKDEKTGHIWIVTWQDLMFVANGFWEK